MGNISMRVLICCLLIAAMAYGSPTCGHLKAVYQEEGGCCGNPAETPALKSPCSPGTKWDGATRQCVQVNKPWYDALIPDKDDPTSWELSKFQFTIKKSVTINAETKVTVPPVYKVVVPSGVTLTNNGEIFQESNQELI